MNKTELKTLLKPLIKECIKEVIFEDGVLSGIVSEVVQGVGRVPLVEVQRTVAPPEEDTFSEMRQKSIEKIRKKYFLEKMFAAKNAKPRNHEN